MKKKLWNFAIALLGMLFFLTGSYKVQAADKVTGVEELRVGGIEIISYEKLTENTLPRGVSYRASTNTLTLNNSTIPLAVTMDGWVENLAGISYRGTKDFNIEILGTNTMTGNSQNPLRCCGLNIGYMWNEDNGDIHLKGTGKLLLKNVEGFLWQEWQGNMKGFGDIFIDGITVESDGFGIVTQANNVTISNAQIKINNKLPMNYYPQGIVIGRTEQNVHYKGTLSIKNSKVEIKNCYTAMACNKYKFSGEYCYSGNVKAEKQLSAKNIFTKNNYGTVDRLVNYDKYLLLSPLKVQISATYKPYKITLDANNGYLNNNGSRVSKSQFEVTYNQNYGSLPNPVRNNYTFLGWYTAKSGGKKITNNTKVTQKSKHTLYAHWKSSIINVSNVTLNKKSLSINVGDSQTLKASITPSNATNKNVTWTTSKKSVVTVNKNGKIKGIKAGTAVITVTTADGKKKAACKVTVKNNVKITCTFPKNPSAFTTGQIYQFEAVASNGGKQFNWTSSNKLVATVNASGKVTLHSPGKVTITATEKSSKIKGSYELTAGGKNYLTESMEIAEGSKIDKGVYATWYDWENKTGNTLIRPAAAESGYTTLSFGEEKEQVVTQQVVFNPSFSLSDITFKLKLENTKSEITTPTLFRLESKQVLKSEAKNVRLYYRDRYHLYQYTVEKVIKSKLTKEVLSKVKSFETISIPIRPTSIDFKWVYSAEQRPPQTDYKIDNSEEIDNSRLIDKIFLDCSELTLRYNSSDYLDTTYRLTAFILPQKVSNSKLNWKSSNPKVVSVDSSGTIIAKSEGTAVITCSATDGSNKKATCKVKSSSMPLFNNNNLNMPISNKLNYRRVSTIDKNTITGITYGVYKRITDPVFIYESGETLNYQKTTGEELLKTISFDIGLNPLKEIIGKLNLPFSHTLDSSFSFSLKYTQKYTSGISIVAPSSQRYYSYYVWEPYHVVTYTQVERMYDENGNELNQLQRTSKHTLLILDEKGLEDNTVYTYSSSQLSDLKPVRNTI